MFKSLVVVILCVGCVCGNALVLPKIKSIINLVSENLKNLEDLPSNVIPLADQPWRAGLWDSDKKEYVCSGTFISEKHVLTAASCVKKCNDELGLIELEVHNFSDEDLVDEYYIKAIDIHNKYCNGDSDELAHNLAILTVEPKSEAQVIFFAELPSPSESTPEEDNLQVAGLSCHRCENPKLKSFKISTLSQESCKRFTNVDGDYFCALNVKCNRGPKSQDLGSAVTNGRSDTIVGVLARADEASCEVLKINSFIKVASRINLNWINQIIAS